MREAIPCSLVTILVLVKFDMSFLTSEQRQIIATNCAEWLSAPVPFIRPRPKNNVRLFTVNKVRWNNTNRTRVGNIMEQLLSVKELLSRSVIIDWTKTGDDVFIIPFDGWKWYPSVITEGIDMLPDPLLTDVITQRLDQPITIRECVEGRGAIGIVGIHKFISIRSSAYASFDALLGDIR